MRSKGYSILGLCVCVCVCVSVTQHLNFHVFICAINGTTPQRRMKVENCKRFTLQMLRCEAGAFPVGTAT